MAEKVSALDLRILLEKEPRLINALLVRGEVIICRHRTTGKVRTMQFKALYENDERFWKNPSSSWDFFLDRKVYDSVRVAFLGDVKEAEEAAPAQTSVPPEAASAPKAAGAPKAGEPAELEAVEDGPVEDAENFGSDYTRLEKMDLSARVAYIDESKKRLDVLIAQKKPDFQVVAEALVETSRDAALVNKATLIEALRRGDSEAKKITQDLVDSTQALVKSTTHLVTEDIFNDDLVKTLVNKSNGTVVQHMTRVFLNGVSFLAYYNKLVLHSSIATKLRIVFDRSYKKHYRKLLPHLHEDAVTLERVFHKGMQAVPENEFHNWATGFLIHDIGKAQAIEYHEGEAAYDREIVVDHVKIGYTAVMNKTNYPRQAGLITGYHHEYYGDPNGYGYFRAYLAKYKQANPKAAQDFCITFELEPMLDFQALAYFPAKILEIVDVFDSLTDANRKYRKPLSPVEALAMMREEFIEKNLKLDPVLFDLFDDFIKDKLQE